jgi:hypothetical protein
MEYVEHCPGTPEHLAYAEGKDGKCTFCNKLRRTGAPRYSPLGEVNPFELGRLLAEKRERERRNQIPQFSDCPCGHKNSLLYDIIHDNFTCKVCGYDIASGTSEYKTIVNGEQYPSDSYQEETEIKQPDKSNLFDHVVWPGDSSKSI